MCTGWWRGVSPDLRELLSLPPLAGPACGRGEARSCADSNHHHALIRSDRKRADRDDVAIAVALDAIGQGFVDRIPFVGCLERQARAPGHADSDRAPSARCIREFAG